MENRVNVEINTDLSKLRERYEYIDRFTHDAFPELNKPVVDSEGLIRGINEPTIHKSLHTGRPVAIIESSDLRKIQKDILMLETEYCNKSQVIDGLNGRMDKKKIKISELKNMIVEQSIGWKEQARGWDEQSKNNALTIAQLKQTITIQDQRIENLTAIVNEKNLNTFKIETKNKVLKEKLNKKNREIERLEKIIEENEHEPMDKVELTWKKPDYLPPVAKWRDRDIVLGLKHTFFDDDYPTEKQENDFRTYAYEGDIAHLQALLSKDNTLINGRGMPDSLGSRVRLWWDKTALMLSAQQGHKKCVEFLVNNGAYINCLDRDKLTALDYAEANHHEEVAIFLKQQGAENGRYLKSIFELKPDLEMNDSFSAESMGKSGAFFQKKRSDFDLNKENLAIRQTIYGVKHSDTQNSAVKFFLGNNPHKESLLKFKNWYYPDVCHYLLHMAKNQAKCIRVIFQDSGYDNNTKTFKNQLQQLVMLSGMLKKPAVFISKEPGADNHFICGLVKSNQLLLINPLGITTHQDCYRILAELKRELIIDQLWLSSNILQQRQYEEENLVSCGPIALELCLCILIHFTPEALVNFWANALKTHEPIFHEATDLTYYGINLNNLLPDTLKDLAKLNEVAYQRKIVDIRQSHCRQLKTLPESAVRSSDESAIETYITQCKEAASAQVVFNALITSHTINTITELKEYTLLKEELNSPVIHLEIGNVTPVSGHKFC